MKVKGKWSQRTDRDLFYYLFIYLFIHFTILEGVELRASHLLSKCFVSWAHSASCFCIGYFSNRVLHLCLAGLDCDFPIYTSCVAEMIAMSHHSQPLIEMGSQKFFAWANLELWSSGSQPHK
jgi:hypothetical protein